MSTATATERVGLYTLDEAAAYLQVGRDHLKKKVAAREYPHTRIGRHTRFSQQNLDDIVAMCQSAVRESAAVIAMRRRGSSRRKTGT